MPILAMTSIKNLYASFFHRQNIAGNQDDAIRVSNSGVVRIGDPYLGCSRVNSHRRGSEPSRVSVF